jgi:cytochrome P450
MTKCAEPVGYDEQEDVWHVHRHADAVRVLTDPVTFSSDIRDFLPPAEYATSFNNKGNFLLMDPPEHRRLRGLVSQAFTPKLVAGLAARISEVTTTLLDATGGATRFDLVEDLAVPLPVIVIAELLGLPAADHRLFRSWAEVLVRYGFESLPSAENIAAMEPTLRDMEVYLLDRVRRRRVEPAGDIISALIAARDDGRSLDDTDIVGFATLLLIGGHVTTTALLGNAVQCFDEHPAAVAELSADSTLLPGAIEEVMRLRPPFTLSERITTTSVRLGGREIPAGARVDAWIVSANRDQSVFPAPGVFDIRRHPNPHLGFGRGIHFCLGAPLARLEAEIALRELLTRYRDLAVRRDVPIEYFPAASNIQAAKNLPVEVVPT